MHIQNQVQSTCPSDISLGNCLLSRFDVLNELNQLSFTKMFFCRSTPDFNATLEEIPRLLSSSMFFALTEGSEVYSKNINLKTTNSIHADNLQVNSFTNVADILAASFAFVYTLAFQSGIFPCKIKIAKLLYCIKEVT